MADMTRIAIVLEISGDAKEAANAIDLALDTGTIQDAIVNCAVDDPPDASWDICEATCNLTDSAAALADIRDLIWPPDMAITEDGDRALGDRSEVLRAIMERLAFLKPDHAKPEVPTS